MPIKCWHLCYVLGCSGQSERSIPCLVEEALLNVESDADVREMWKGLSFICYMHPLESRVHRCEMKKALVKQI